jgi:hypothetical protein
MKIIRQMEIYKETEMPNDGWIQGCFICYAPTAQLIDTGESEKSNVITEYLVHLCYECQNIVKKSESVRKEYNNCINIYIADNAI